MKKPEKKTECARCGLAVKEELLRCPQCEEEVCTDRCIAGRNVRCFQCEESGE